MEFEWNSEKREANAVAVFLDGRRLEGFDEEHNGEEERWWAIGMVRNNVLFVVYTERGEVMRIISARKATTDEQRAYYESFSA